MLEYIKTICFFMIVTTVLLNLFPNEQYVKYVRLVIGFILILIVITPIVDKENIVNIEKYLVEFSLEEETISEKVMEYESVINKRIEEMSVDETVNMYE